MFLPDFTVCYRDESLPIIIGNLIFWRFAVKVLIQCMTVMTHEKNVVDWLLHTFPYIFSSPTFIPGASCVEIMDKE